jgi:hypothetical protein
VGCESGKLHIHISRDRISRCGAKQVDTRCFLLLLGLGLLFREFDGRSRGDSRLSIRIWQARLGVWVWQTIWVGQALRFLGVLGSHGVSKNIGAGAAAKSGNCWLLLGWVACAANMNNSGSVMEEMKSGGRR